MRKVMDMKRGACGKSTGRNIIVEEEEEKSNEESK
jgi:hypothetical protein